MGHGRGNKWESQSRASGENSKSFFLHSNTLSEIHVETHCHLSPNRKHNKDISTRTLPQGLPTTKTSRCDVQHAQLDDG